MNANKIIKGVVTVTAICIALLLLWYLSRVVLYVLLSAVLAIVGRPLVKYLQRLRIGSYEPSRTAASIVTLVVMWLVAGGLIALFVPLVFDKVNDLASLDIDTFMAAIRRPVEDMQLALQHLFAFSEFSTVCPFFCRKSTQVCNPTFSSFVTLLNLGIPKIVF